MSLADTVIKQLAQMAEAELADGLERYLRGGIGAMTEAELVEVVEDLEGAVRALRARNPRGRPRKDRAAALLSDAVATLLVKGASG